MSLQDHRRTGRARVHACQKTSRAERATALPKACIYRLNHRPHSLNFSSMAIPPRTAAQGTFFLTTVTYNRRRLFQVPANAELFLETLQHYRTAGAYFGVPGQLAGWG